MMGSMNALKNVVYLSETANNGIRSRPIYIMPPKKKSAGKAKKEPKKEIIIPIDTKLPRAGNLVSFDFVN